LTKIPHMQVFIIISRFSLVKNSKRKDKILG
jgi:hypothetical protein